MPDVSRCEGGTPCQRNARDLCVSHINCLSGPLTDSCQHCRLRCRRAVEIQHTILQVLLQQLDEACLEGPAAARPWAAMLGRIGLRTG